MGGMQAMARVEATAPERVREEFATMAPRADAQRIELGGASARIAVPLSDSAAGRIRALIAHNAPHQVYLRLDDICIARMSGVFYQVYINPPAGASFDSETPGYVGNLIPFGLKPHAMAGNPALAQNVFVQYDISHLVGPAIARDPKGLNVVLVPRGLVDLHDQPVPVPATVQGTLGAVRIIGGLNGG